MPRKIRIFRYDPNEAGSGHFDSFTLEVPDERMTTILDVLLRVQEEQDPTLAFRFACRVNMCGSCGMVINGEEALACKKNVSEIPAGEEITIRPLNHFPVIKDLVVDMKSFFEKYESVLSFYEPKDADAEPAKIQPGSQERLDIGDATECIACGCCVSSCTMVHQHEGYAGPAALNRAFTLLADSRDSLFSERLDRALESCYSCRSELNCTEVCPKGISPTHAIKYIQRLAVTHPPEKRPSPHVPAEPETRPSLHVLAPHIPKKKGWHPLAMAAGVTCLAGLLYVALMGLEGARAYGQFIPVPDRPLTASETRGLHLYASLQCAYCHQILGEGGHRTGPDLSNMAAKRRTRDYLAAYIRNPQVVSPHSIMPSYNVPAADLQSLADFVLALDFGKYAEKILKREEVLKNE